MPSHLNPLPIHDTSSSAEAGSLCAPLVVVPLPVQKEYVACSRRMPSCSARSGACKGIYMWARWTLAYACALSAQPKKQQTTLGCCPVSSHPVPTPHTLWPFTPFTAALFLVSATALSSAWRTSLVR